MRVSLLSSQPVVQTMMLQYCIWQEAGGDPYELENCSNARTVVGESGNGYQWSTPMDLLWLKDGIPIAWDIPRSSDGVAIKTASGDPVSGFGEWNWGGQDPDEWYPFTMRFSAVLVAEGYTFSGWQNYP